MFLIIKLFLQLAALKLHDVVDKPIPPTLLYTLSLIFIGLISTSFILHTLFFSLVLAMLSMLYFWLLSHFPSGTK
ncbi:hypothetical protein AB6T38_07155 [Aliiglaciecola sp. SL4]|uniref:hypothetical protein n=1 Tax=Aliiglaciecola sp. SL4 TaxID=3239806 RepID=UPI00355B28B5